MNDNNTYDTNFEHCGPVRPGCNHSTASTNCENANIGKCIRQFDDLGLCENTWKPHNDCASAGFNNDTPTQGQVGAFDNFDRNTGYCSGWNDEECDNHYQCSFQTVQYPPTTFESITVHRRSSAVNTDVADSNPVSRPTIVT